MDLNEVEKYRLSTKQCENILELVVKVAYMSLRNKMITDEEYDAIIQFVANGAAAINTLNKEVWDEK